MLPGKKFTPEDILQILRKRYWFILLPFAITSAATAVWVRYLPDQYQSDTSILVVPQRVPENYVRPTVTSRIEDRLQTITQQILSRTRLERIINEYNLYPKERKEGIMEDVVQKMRDDIHPEVLRGDAFRITYVGDNPRTVQKVTERLASLFIEENLNDRATLADSTNQFLEAQLEETRRNLEEQEKKVAEYRMKHSGELPTQADSNAQRLQMLQVQLQNLSKSLDDDRERRLLLERQVADAEQLIEDTPVSSAPAAVVSGDSTLLAQQLAEARNRLSVLEGRYSPTYPEVRTQRRLVQELEQKVAAEPQTVKAQDGRPLSPAEQARRRRLDDLRSQLTEVDRRMSKTQAEEGRLRNEAGMYAARLEAVPQRENELTELTRDYNTFKEQYASLAAKKEDSKLAANLERRQIGEQFKLLDAARIPERPFYPNRPRLSLFGMAAGIAIGLGLVALLEYRDKSFKTDLEVFDVLALPVLAVVPVMKSVEEQRKLFRRRLTMGIGLSATVMLCFATVVYTWVR